MSTGLAEDTEWMSGQDESEESGQMDEKMMLDRPADDDFVPQCIHTVFGDGSDSEGVGCDGRWSWWVGGRERNGKILTLLECDGGMSGMSGFLKYQR